MDLDVGGGTYGYLAALITVGDEVAEPCGDGALCASHTNSGVVGFPYWSVIDVAGEVLADGCWEWDTVAEPAVTGRVVDVDVQHRGELVASGGRGVVEGTQRDFAERVDPGDIGDTIAEQGVVCFVEGRFDDHTGIG